MHKAVLTSLAAVFLISACAHHEPAPSKLPIAPAGPTKPSFPIGPDVAVMLIKIGREKQPQRVVIGLYDDAAPLATANLKKLAHRKFYNGMRFHRVFEHYLVQTGDPHSRYGDRDISGTGGPGYTLPAEIKRNHIRGAVAAARLDDKVNPTRESNGSQFYVCLQPMPQLDGKYTVFGEVIEGIEVLDYISGRPTNSNDFPLEKIVITSIKIEPRIAAPAAVR
ncbi:MAG: peptidylprolyl isomerase [Terrimicrobiaceae bacterium]|nr:peptidylprolyl isomerase [Terrimicrobiaceae bacterium]